MRGEADCGSEAVNPARHRRGKVERKARAATDGGGDGEPQAY
jgi:hypothetical protein